jgi:uncharacterized protein YjeT (DUF2065 family)
MDTRTLWLALALVLIIEGFLPFASPAQWRKMFMQILQLKDEQIRFFGLCCVLFGVAVLWILS